MPDENAAPFPAPTGRVPTKIPRKSDPGSPTVEYVDAVLDAWMMDTSVFSSPSAIMAHPAHAHLASLGEIVASRILERMEGIPGSVNVGWFGLLQEITGKTPEIPEHHWGDIEGMARHWVEWAKMHSYGVYVPFG